MTRHLHSHLQREPIPMEDYIMPDKQRMKRIRKNVRAAIKELWTGWIRPIVVMILGLITLIAMWSIPVLWFT